MGDAKKCFDDLTIQEYTLSFDKFSRSDALELGLLINKNAQKYGKPITIEITVNGLAVFRFFSDGSIKDSELWLSRKRNTVELMGMSSLRFMYWLETFGETLESRKLSPKDYAVGGGGFPIRLRGTGVVGSICVSGLPDHMDDHKLVTDSVSEFLKIG